MSDRWLKIAGVDEGIALVTTISESEERRGSGLSPAGSSPSSDIFASHDL